MSLEDAIEQYGDPDAGSEVSSVPSGTNPVDMSLEAPETVEEARPPAFLPPLMTCPVQWSQTTSNAFGWPLSIFIPVYVP